MKLKLLAITTLILGMLGISAYTMNKAFEITGDLFYWVSERVCCGFMSVIVIMVGLYYIDRRKARE